MFLTMFTTCSGGSADFKSSWEKKRTVHDNTTQTIPFLLQENECQTPEKHDAEVQVDPVERKSVGDVAYDPESLAAFLQKVAPLVCSALERNKRSNAFSHYYIGVDSENTSTQQLHSLSYQKFSEQFQCNDVSWNSTGTVLAVAYGVKSHENWCEHDCAVAVWNLHRKDFSSTKPNTLIETDCCVNSLAFHPELPAILAAGKFNGEILLLNIGKEDDMLMANSEASTDSHREPITCLHWIKDSGIQNKFKLVSSSLDGKILVWVFNERTQTLELIDGFILVTKDLPWSIPAKSSSPNAEIGVTSFSFNSEDPSIFVVGAEGGGVFLCSLNSQVPVNYMLASSVQFKSPLTMGFSPHQGYVSAVHFSPHSRNLFLTCSTDGELRVYSLLESKPLLTLPSLVGFQKAQWSPVRPLVIAAVCSDGHFQMFDLMASRSVPVSNFMTQDGMPCSTLQFSEQNLHLAATGSGNGAVQIWQLGTSFTETKDKENEILQEMSAAISD